MSIEIPAGLHQFPLTKICMVSGIVLSVFASVFQTKYWFLLHRDPFISEYHQYYRYITFQIACINESDMAITTLLWYQLRHLERLLGSRKYANLILVSWIYTTCTLVILNLFINMIPGIKWNKFINGPLPIILALFHFYKEYTPSVYQFDVLLIKSFHTSKQLKWNLNDQFFLNALIFLLLINQGWRGVFSGFIGWICGIFIDNKLFPGLECLKLPLFSDSWNKSPSMSRNNIRAININDTTESEDHINREEEPQDEPLRPLGVQFLDMLRR